jgi:hypothetical protein
MLWSLAWILLPTVCLEMTWFTAVIALLLATTLLGTIGSFVPLLATVSAFSREGLIVRSKLDFLLLLSLRSRLSRFLQALHRCNLSVKILEIRIRLLQLIKNHLGVSASLTLLDMILINSLSLFVTEYCDATFTTSM